MKKGMFGGFHKEEMSDIEKIKRQNEIKFNIDDILDRITSVGIENLTPEEKRFLDSYNNE
jgi:acid stress-induced BolA-like protein IbaG/YrbA